MKKIVPVILIRSLDVMRGGVTKASIKRANLLAEKNEKVIIVTFLYQQYHKQIIRTLYKKGMLSKNVQVVNFFEDMKPTKRKIRRLRYKRKFSVKEKGFIEFPVKEMEVEPSYRYYKDGLYLKYKRYTKNGVLKFIDYMDSSRHRVKREEFNEEGILVRTRHMDKNNNKPRLDQYFDDSGFCYLSIHVNPKTGRDGMTALFTDNPKEFGNLYDCYQMWLDSILKDIKYPVVTCELRGLHRLLRNVKHPNIKKIEVVHTNHLIEPFDDKKKMKKSYTQLFEHATELDHIVFLTNEQKQDVESVYGEHNNFTVIPHAIEQNNEVVDNDQNNNVAVTLARYHEDKRLNEAIHAFQYVVEKIPKAQYHIYGYGALENELQTLINKLRLENNVFLKKYTLDPKAVYRSAACSILTSKQEGFAMVITESMAEGTLVISYDIKYGPGDIINNNENGFLVKDGDRKQLAEKIIDVMNDNELRQRLSKNALNVIEDFSEEKYRNQWLEIINSHKE